MNIKYRKKVVVLTGAGISAESGLKTFRDSDGLWEGHKVEDVATPEAWRRNPSLVLEFYNQRRATLLKTEPNPGHLALVKLEEKYDVTVVTQNVDNLHERAGSSHVIHLHGELLKSRSSIDPALVFDITGTELNLGDKCPKGSQLRPHIVWFGEAVPMMDLAIEEASKAEIFLIVGTSLVVYPAAELVDYIPEVAEVFVVDPKKHEGMFFRKIVYIEEKASIGVPMVVEGLIS